MALPGVRFEVFVEGSAAQIMHVGPFSEGEPAVQRVHDFIEESGVSGQASTTRSA